MIPLEVLSSIIKWWTESGKTYPWRESRDPFHILIAEIMLQRTRRDKVAEVFPKFVKKFPDAKSVAEADLEELRKVLKPLGLAHRVPRMKKLAEIVARSGGVPEKYEDLLSLPGVGPYIASAVLCFGFGQPISVVDANIVRVVARITGLKTTGKREQDKKLVEEILLNSVPPRMFRKVNLAMLDLAWELCKPRNPICKPCPVRNNCNHFLRRSEHE